VLQLIGHSLSEHRHVRAKIKASILSPHNLDIPDAVFCRIYDSSLKRPAFLGPRPGYDDDKVIRRIVRPQTLQQEEI
jgi:hypothetical protein